MGLRRVIFASAMGVLVLLAGACASSKKEIQAVDTSLEIKGSVNGKQLGFNGDNEIILQEEISADQELKSQIWINNKLIEDLGHERHQLQRCRDDLSDPRLGGPGLAGEVPEIDEAMVQLDQENIGLDDEDEFKVVRRQSFTKRLKWERKRERDMKKLTKLVKKMRRECEQKMRFARIKHGLPPSRYEPKGHFTEDGTWIMTQQGEQTLNDAFEISAKLRANRASESSGMKIR